MKIKLLTLLLLLVTISASAQEKKKPKFSFDTPFFLEFYSPFALQSNDSIPELNSLFGVGMEFKLAWQKWQVNFQTSFAFNTSEKHGYRNTVSSIGLELYGGRIFKLGDDFNAVTELGYNYMTYNYRLTNSNQTTDFNKVFETNTRELMNTAHRIVPRLTFDWKQTIQLGVSYHWDVSQNRWNVENGTIINAPKENFSSWRATISFNL